MKKPVIGAAVLLGLAITTSAHAVVNVCDGPSCAPWDTNVNITANSQPVVGVTNSNPAITVNFTSTEALVAPSTGLSRVEAADGLLSNITFSLAGSRTFDSAVFNLFPLAGNAANQALLATITWALPGGGTGSQQISINPNGQNDTGIFGTEGERFLSVTFQADPATAGINDLRQLRLGTIRNSDGTPNPQGFLPEPTTWAMMLVGFGLIGATMRRRREHQAVRLTYV